MYLVRFELKSHMYYSELATKPEQHCCHNMIINIFIILYINYIRIKSVYNILDVKIHM